MSAFSRLGDRSGSMDIETNSGGASGLPAPALSYHPPPSPSNFELSSTLSSPPRLHKLPGFRRYNSNGSDSSNSAGGGGGGAKGGAFQPFSSVRLRKGSGSLSGYDEGSSIGMGMAQSSSSSSVYSDRFIPSRNASDLEGAFDYVDHGFGPNAHSVMNNGIEYENTGGHRTESSRESQGIMNTLLRSELLGQEQGPGRTLYSASPGSSSSSSSSSRSFEGGLGGATGAGGDPMRSSTDSVRSTGSVGGETGNGSIDMRGVGSAGQNVLRFRSDRRRSSGDSASIRSDNSAGSGDSSSNGGSNRSGLLGAGGFGSLPGSPSVLGGHLGSPSLRKTQRKINKTPYKVLDAPALQDDYYLNLVDWSSNNMLSVALGCNVYLWSAFTSKVVKLCDTGTENAVTSICWSPQGTHLAVGTHNGKVQIWDVQESKMVRSMNSHASRVGTMAWSSILLATGSRDRTIMMQDARIRGGEGSAGSMAASGIGSSSGYTVGPTNIHDPCVVHELTAHKQEVCGLKWSPDERMLASGGNDNKLYVWALNHANPATPICRFSDHNAAVKAVAWSPHQSGLLASGGGTADRNIRFWNAQTGVSLHRVDTGSQVCNLMWSKTVNEIVSTHGYSLNQIIVWKYPSMQKVATLTGHSLRVLYLAMSPDGQSVVTGAGDETLRFWNLFPGSRSTSGARSSGLLFPGSDIR